MSSNQTLRNENRFFIPPTELKDNAYMQDYEAIYHYSISQPERCWKGIAAELEGFAKENKVISVEVDNHLPKAWADRDLVHRVLSNLLTNALKHTPAKTEISIHVRLDTNAKAFVVSVQDTGEGVPPDESRVTSLPQPAA